MRRAWMGAVAALAWAAPGSAQSQPGTGHWGVEIGVVAATVSYAHVVSEAALGVGLGGGAQVGTVLLSGTLADGGRGNPSIFLELASASAFWRRAVGGNWEVEPGLRLAWNYHSNTEYETVFFGAYAGVFRKVGRVWVGARGQVGRLREEAGRTEVNVGVAPVLIRIRSR